MPEPTEHSKRMTRVYVAGAYSADNVITILDNMRRGMKTGKDVMLAGYAPFVPWFDFHFQLLLDEGETLDVGDYYRYSIAWLEGSDCMLVVPHSENSNGTQAEIARAKELGLPTYYSIMALTSTEPRWRPHEKY